MRELREDERLLLLELLDASHQEKLHELHSASTVNYQRLLRDKIEIIEELKALLAVSGAAK